MLLATGIAYRKLGVPGADALTGRGVFYGSAVTEAPACVGDDVYIVGGANSAGQAAVFLARHARRVTLLVRADSLEKSMSYYLIRQIDEIPNIEVRLGTEVSAVHGDEHLEGLTLCRRASRSEETVPRRLPLRVHRRRASDRVARRSRGPGRQRVRAHRAGPGGRRSPAAGLAPRTATPTYLEASAPGIFAAGDVRANSVKRVASAVGEGAMAIQLIHGYLEHQ